MRRIGVVVLAVGALFTISTVLAADTNTSGGKKATAQAAPAPMTAQADSPLVRAAKISYQSRLHPKSRFIIDSNTLIVSRWPTSTAAPAVAPGPDAQGRSWASGNSGDAGAIAARERTDRDQRSAAEQARQQNLKQEQAYMAQQDQEPYSEIIDDHVTNRLETIPTEMKQKPPQ